MRLRHSRRETEATEGTPLRWLADFAALQQFEELARAAWGRREYQAAGEYFAAAAAAGARTQRTDVGIESRVRAARAFLKADRPDLALAQFRDAASEGFRFPEMLSRDPSWASLRTRAGFRGVLEVSSRHARAYEKLHRRADRAKVEFGDIDRFWLAYDLAKQTRRAQAKAALFREHYLGPGTPGLIEHFALRTSSAEALVAQIEEVPQYYEGIRARTLKARALEPLIRNGLRRLLRLCPGSVVPDVTFVIGRLNAAGSVGLSGMLMGLEMFSWSKRVPLHGFSSGMRETLRTLSFQMLPLTVIHEHVHMLQRFNPQATLLDVAIAEGTADFLAGLALPRSPTPAHYRWGLARERAVWKAFRKEMGGTDLSRWLHNQERVTSRWPADIGYFVGARIAEAHYERARDKQHAIVELLTVSDTAALLERSGYDPLRSR